MGTGRGATRAAVGALAVLVAGSAGASVVTEPIARLTLEGGYDSNALYDGRGGSNVGRISPDLGLSLADHLWKLQAAYGGDFLVYPQIQSQGVWNQRGRLYLDAIASRRLKVHAEANGEYAVDPVGLARFGILRPSGGPTLLAHAAGRVAWNSDRHLQLAATLTEQVAHFDDGSGSVLHSPGVEAMYRPTHYDAVGGAFRVGVFQPLSTGSGAMTNELKAIWRREASRHLDFDLEAGPALWIGKTSTALIPEAAVTALASSRRLDARFTLQQGLGVGSAVNVSLAQSAELGLTARPTRSWRLHADGGLFRSGAPPYASTGAVSGYIAGGEIGYLVGGGVEVSLAASRFARLDDPSPRLQRSVIGLRVGWALKQR